MNGREERLELALREVIIALRVLVKGSPSSLAGIDAQRILARIARAEQALAVVEPDAAVAAACSR